MKVRITNNLDRFTYEMEERLAGAFEQMAEDTKRYSQMKVPKDTGALRETAEVEKLSRFRFRVWYDRYNDLGYAEVQETNQFVNYTKPGTGPHYLENAAKRIEGVATKYIKVALARIKI